MTDEKVIDKLRKLVAHEQSARKIGNVQEAEAFAGRINEWLLKHKLSMSDVEIAEERELDPVGKEYLDPEDLGVSGKRRWAWLETLAGVIARAHFCNIMIIEGSRTIIFVGRAGDREAAIYLYSYLVTLILHLADKAAAEYKKSEEYRTAVGDFLDEREDEGKATPVYAAQAAVVRAFRKSYYKGFTSAISRRFYEQRKAAEATVEPESTALISLRDTESQVAEFIKGESAGKASGFKSGGYNQTGYAAGVNAGRSVGLTGKVIEGRAG